MTEETIDPILAKSIKRLARNAAQYCVGRKFDRQTIQDVEGIYRDHRAAARIAGIDFPEMVLVIMDVSRRLRFVRRNLDDKGIDNLCVELAKAQGIHYDPGEIARGIRRAFPHHRAPDPRDRKN
jgi:hypothetical protein